MDSSSKHINFSTGALRKWPVLLFAILLLSGFVQTHAQVLRNNGAAVTISPGVVVTGKDIENKADTITNNGTIVLTGNWTDSASYVSKTGTVQFNDSTNNNDQVIIRPGGETFHDFTVNRGFLWFFRTVQLNNDVTITHNFNVTKGILN